MCFGVNHYKELENPDAFEGIERYENPQVKKSIDTLIKSYQQLLLEAASTQAFVEMFEILGEDNPSPDYEGPSGAELIANAKAFTRVINKEKSFIIFEDVKTELKQSMESGVAVFEYSEKEVQDAFFKSDIGQFENTILGYSTEELIDKFDAKVSFVFPVISETQEISKSGTYKIFFGRKLYDIADSDSSYENYFENLTEMFQRASAMKSTSDLLKKIAASQEYRLLFSYAVPIPELINMYLIFFNLILDTDKNVRNSFIDTKNVMASSIESIYSTRGKDAYKYAPPSITKQGGPKGIAQNASIKFNSPST